MRLRLGPGHHRRGGAEGPLFRPRPTPHTRDNRQYLRALLPSPEAGQSRSLGTLEPESRQALRRADPVLRARRFAPRVLRPEPVRRRPGSKPRPPLALRGGRVFAYNMYPSATMPAKRATGNISPVTRAQVEPLSGSAARLRLTSQTAEAAPDASLNIRTFHIIERREDYATAAITTDDQERAKRALGNRYTVI